MKTTTVEFSRPHGVRIVADAWGDPRHHGIAFFHGGGQTRHAWKNSAQHLAQLGFYAMSVDLRGHGDSSWDPAGQYLMAERIGDIAAVTASFQGPPILVGASLGGIISLLYAGERANTPLRGLVLVDIVHRNSESGISKIHEFMCKHGDGFATLDEAADAIAAYQPHRKRPRNLRSLQKNLRQRDDGRWYWHWDPKILNAEATEEVRDPERLLRAARAVQAPILLVRGLASEMVQDEHAHEFLREVPGAREVAVPDAAHMIAGDANDRFTAAVKEFLLSL